MENTTNEMGVAPMLGQLDADLTVRHGTSEVGAAAREQAEIQSAMILAQKFKRREENSFARIMRAVERPAMAEDSQYEFPRGGKTVSGPSVYLAREFARCWGNIRHGKRILDAQILGQPDDFILVRGYAYDLETNTYAESEDRFRPMVQRKNKSTGRTEWVNPDDRDLRELVNKHASICQRNAILEILPPDMVDEVCKHADETLVKSARGELSENPEDAKRRLVMAFSRLGVTSEMLDTYLGHPLQMLSGDELVALRKIYKSIQDGVAKVGEFFSTGEVAPENRAAKILDEIKTGKQKGSDQKPQFDAGKAQSVPHVSPEQMKQSASTEKSPR